MALLSILRTKHSFRKVIARTILMFLNHSVVDPEVVLSTIRELYEGKMNISKSELGAVFGGKSTLFISFECFCVQ